MESFIREGLHIVNEMPIEDMAYIDASVASPDSSDLIIIGEGSNGKVYRYKNYAIKILLDVLEQKEGRKWHNYQAQPFLENY